MVGQTNYAYVRSRTAARQTATNVMVKGYHANPAAGLFYPIDWKPMTTAQLAAPNVPANNERDDNRRPVRVDAAACRARVHVHDRLGPGDASNASNIAAGDTIPEWRLVPNDNNIGQRNVAPVPGGGGLVGPAAAFEKRGFTLKNPLGVRAGMQMEVTFPAFLRDRGWTMRFLNPGGAAPVLEAGASQPMVR